MQLRICCSATSKTPRKYVLQFMILSAFFTVLFIYGFEMQLIIFQKILPGFQSSYARAIVDKPVILAWTNFFSRLDFDVMLRDRLVDCPFKCEIRARSKNQTSGADDERADAIIFHIRDLHANDLPRHRRAEQYFIFFLQESPIYSNGIQVVPRDFFNATIGYLRVPGAYRWTYGDFYPINETSYSPLRNWTIVTEKQIDDAIKQKNTVAFTLISNCYYQNSKRASYIQALSGHMNLTLRGNCYSSTAGGGKCDSSCERNLTQSHFFYLAFENSVCKEYVTEKFFRIQHLIVPVVLRRAILKGIAPDSCFVAADDFSSPNELANFLLAVSKNMARYREFFGWTQRFYKETPECSSGVCNMCRDLHFGNVSSPWPRSSPDIQEYYSPKQCEPGAGEKLARGNSTLP